MVVREIDDPQLFRYISDRNLLHQYDVLQTDVEVAITAKQAGISNETFRRLQNAVTYYLCDNPGKYRTCPIGITNSQHQPPDWSQVQRLQDELVNYINVNWDSKSLIHLAAMALWSICWTHPFEEGNGRTARAAAYYIICVKSRMWLPGKDIIPQQIRANRTPYYAALHAADRSLASGTIDLTALESYLSVLLRNQLTAP